MAKATVTTAQPGVLSAAVAPLAMSAAQITANIKGVGAKSKALDTLIHKTGVAVIISSMPLAEGGHNDAGKALKLVQAMSEGQSRKRVAAWFERYSNIRVTAKVMEDGSLAWMLRLIKPSDKAYKAADPVAANATPFWKLNVEADVTPVVIDSARFASMLANMIKQLDKARDEKRLNLTPVELNEVEALRKRAQDATKRAERLVHQAGAAIVQRAAKAHVDPLVLAKVG